jgi:hypothetical protein
LKISTLKWRNKIKTYILPIITLLFLIPTKSEANEQRYSFGLGMGSIYSGIGSNFAIISDKDMKYISIGCIEYSSNNGAECGLGLGWVNTDLFSPDNNKHGLGLYISMVGHESNTIKVNGNFETEENDIYGLGVSYTYFFNGIGNSGMNIGISSHLTNADYKDNYGGFLQIGYQF